MFTRFHDDKLRIQKQLQESTGPGRYALNVPGPADKQYYLEDPHVRLQKWGANLKTNSILIENDLRGMTRKMNRDCRVPNDYKEYQKTITTDDINVKTLSPFVDESRATTPAWEVRGMETNRWNYLHNNPQEHTCFHFQNNLSTRILEKDHYGLKHCNNPTFTDE